MRVGYVISLCVTEGSCSEWKVFLEVRGSYAGFYVYESGVLIGFSGGEKFALGLLEVLHQRFEKGGS